MEYKYQISLDGYDEEDYVTGSQAAASFLLVKDLYNEFREYIMLLFSQFFTFSLVSNFSSTIQHFFTNTQEILMIFVKIQKIFTKKDKI